LILDSLGIGQLPDAYKFKDLGCNTLGHIAETVNLSLPNLVKMGIANLTFLKGLEPVSKPLSFYGKMAELSEGKDTTVGHWELMGIYTKTPFKTYPNGFEEELIAKLEEKTKRKVIGNKVASGTQIIEELGKEHIATGNIIVYTSADSVLQIAAHEDVIQLKELYRICEIARELTFNPKHLVARVIARPFKGKPGSFVRTENRRDFSIEPPYHTVLDYLYAKGINVVSIGKVADIYANRGIHKSFITKCNNDGIAKLLHILSEEKEGLIFINLVDFDTKYGHRRDVLGYAKALEEFDKQLPEILELLNKDDLFIITADHGNDPTFHGTDHTREYVPLLVFRKGVYGKNLGVFPTFSCVGATIAANFKVKMPAIGFSFLEKLV